MCSKEGSLFRVDLNVRRGAQHTDQDELAWPLLHVAYDEMRIHPGQALSVVFVHLLQRRLGTTVSTLVSSLGSLNLPVMQRHCMALAVRGKFETIYLYG